MSTQLDTLPTEILFNILSFTEPTCDPTQISFPLCTMAATSKHMNAIVEEYARSLLKQHTDTTGRKASTNTWRRKWLAELCQYCKKKTKRKATLHPVLTCCRPCDFEHFPKMTMTNAISLCSITKLDLFTPNALHRDLPRLTVGPYSAHGSHAVMISEPDVLARRDHIFELLGEKSDDREYMRRRFREHERLIKHLGVHFNIHLCDWVEVDLSADQPARPKSMSTQKNRAAYVKQALEREWEELGRGTSASDTEDS